jgi:hypothetical protein
VGVYEQDQKLPLLSLKRKDNSEISVEPMGYATIAESPMMLPTQVNADLGKTPHTLMMEVKRRESSKRQIMVSRSSAEASIELLLTLLPRAAGSASCCRNSTFPSPRPRLSFVTT